MIPVIFGSLLVHMSAKRFDILILTILTDVVHCSEVNRVVILPDTSRRSWTEG
jgi:hypothetical protein